MREHIPSESAMTELLGHALFAVWQKLCAAIDEAYEMERHTMKRKPIMTENG